MTLPLTTQPGASIICIDNGEMFSPHFQARVGAPELTVGMIYTFAGFGPRNGVMIEEFPRSIGGALAFNRRRFRPAVLPAVLTGLLETQPTDELVTGD